MSAKTAASVPLAARRDRIVLAVICLLLVAVPFLAVEFPPLTDLPQHTAQVRLFLDAVRNPGSPYAVQWLTPYGLGYSLMGLAWGLAGPLDAGRIAFLLLALLWVLTVHWLAAVERRPAAFAVLASLLVFNHALYWGFFPFLFGWPVFVLFLRVSAPTRAFSLRAAAQWMGLSLALYLSHALWFAFAAIWVVLDGIRVRLAIADQIRRWLTLLPVALLAAWWFLGLQSRSFETGTAWISSPPERLLPLALVDGILGALKGNVEPVILALMVAIVVAGLALRRNARHPDFASLDGRLLALAAMFLVLYLILPLKFQNTIRFAERWLPYAAVCGVLALPEPVRWRRGLTAAALLLLAALCGVTTLRWMAFDRFEMAGMREALRALPERPTVMGLSYAPQSALFKTLPFLQDFAYAQVRHGGELAFSFADYAPSLVVYRPPRATPWTSGLQFAPERVTREDLGRFPFVLVHGTSADQEHVGGLGELTPLTGNARWRLYGRTPDQEP